MDLPEPSFNQNIVQEEERGADPNEPTTRMPTSSCKAKGRRHQQWVATELKKEFPHLEGNDIRSLSMGCAGDDLILSPAALKVVPYNFEMKNVENFQVWATLAQVNKRYQQSQLEGSQTLPCVVVKRNRTDPVVIIPFGHFCNLMYMAQTSNTTEYWLPECLTLAQMQLLLANITNLASLVAATWPVPIQKTEPSVLITATPIGRFHLHLHEKSMLNFWKVWPELHARYKKTKKLVGHPFACIFHRGQPNHVVYAAIKFSDFVALLHYRWAYLRNREECHLTTTALQA